MADSFNKKEREKKRQKRKKDKAERREQKKQEGSTHVEFMYLDEDGNLVAEKPDPTLKKKKMDLADIEISTRKTGKATGSKFSKVGVVKFFNTEKGYGFIEDNETSQSYFVHVDSLRDRVKDGDKVNFEVGKGPKGPIATEVKLFKE